MNKQNKWKHKKDDNMNLQALFSDGTENYIFPNEPEVGDVVTLRFRTAKDDADEVRLLTGFGNIQMKKEKNTKGDTFDFYRTSVRIGVGGLSYYFQVKKGDDVCYFHRGGVTQERVGTYEFNVVPGFRTPDWAKGAVMYQIYVDRFFNGDKTNDVETNEYIYINQKCVRVTDWNKYPEVMDVREFYGGDLEGVIQKLDYLEDLGIEVIYFNPLFVSPSNHKYDTQDYDYIDPHIGKIVVDHDGVLPENAMSNRNAEKYRVRTTDKRNLEASNLLFIRLVEEAHKRNIRVIIDGVFNHCGSFNKWMDAERIYEKADGYAPGAYLDRKSPYRDYFHFYNQEGECWPQNDNYEGWWGHHTLPKLNYEGSRELEEYILNIGRKWVSPPYNADGWRLDVAADLGQGNEYNHKFWKKFRKAVKEANPEALILAEHYGDPSDWLQGDEWDTVMNYDAFMEPVTWFLTGMEKHSDEYRGDLYGNADYFIGVMRHHMANMMCPSLQTAMNELSNHDHSRFLTRTNREPGRITYKNSEDAEKGVMECVMREAVVIQMTWPGTPTVYYGDEAGLCGYTDPDDRRTYPWGRENQELLKFHKDIIRIHKEHPVLKTGSVKMLTWGEHLLSYGRFMKDAKIIVVINNSKERREVVVPVWMAETAMAGRMKRLLYSYEKGYTTEYEEYIIENGEIVVIMGPHSALILEEKEQAGNF